MPLLRLMNCRTGMEMERNKEERLFHCEKIAVLLAAYNGRNFIREQLDSLLAQTFQEWTLFIHDDGSTDGTPEILSEYAERFPEKIVLIDAPSKGSAGDNFMFLLNSVDAPYIMFCDQDDVWLPQKIEKTYQRMKEVENGRPALVFSDLQIVDQDLKIIAPLMSGYQKLDMTKHRVEDFLAENVITGCTMMIDRPLAELSRKCQDPSQIIVHDWWAALVAAKFGVISCIEEPLIKYRQHGENSIGAKRFGLQYIKERVTHMESIRKRLEATRIQAGHFSSVFDLGAEDVVTQYADIAEKNKIYRLRFYAENHIRKSGFARNVGLCIWG